MWEVIRVDFVRLFVAENVEGARVLLGWLLQVDCLVEVIVHDLAEVDEAPPAVDGAGGAGDAAAHARGRPSKHMVLRIFSQKNHILRF